MFFRVANVAVCIWLARHKTRTEQQKSPLWTPLHVKVGVGGVSVGGVGVGGDTCGGGVGEGIAGVGVGESGAASRSVCRGCPAGGRGRGVGCGFGATLNHWGSPVEMAWWPGTRDKHRFRAEQQPTNTARHRGRNSIQGNGCLAGRACSTNAQPGRKERGVEHRKGALDPPFSPAQ